MRDSTGATTPAGQEGIELRAAFTQTPRPLQSSRRWNRGPSNPQRFRIEELETVHIPGHGSRLLVAGIRETKGPSHERPTRVVLALRGVEAHDLARDPRGRAGPAVHAEREDLEVQDGQGGSVSRRLVHLSEERRRVRIASLGERHDAALARSAHAPDDLRLEGIAPEKPER